MRTKLVLCALLWATGAHARDPDFVRMEQACQNSPEPALCVDLVKQAKNKYEQGDWIAYKDLCDQLSKYSTVWYMLPRSLPPY